MRKLLPLFALLCLVGTAAPKPKANPQIALGSCTPGVVADCDSASPISLVLTDLDPHKLYIVDVNDGAFEPGGILNPDTDTLDLNNLILAPGSYTFTVMQVNHNGTPTASFGSTQITVD